MATADLITAFLSNEMSPERERQFLLSVAASDALRLELKSHLMVDRILVERVQRAHVSDAVRATIFAQAGIASLAATGAESASAAQPASGVDRAPAPRASFLSRLGGRVTLFAAAAALFGAGYFVGADNDDASVAARSAAPDVNVAARNAAPATSADERGATESPGLRSIDKPVVSSSILEPRTEASRTTTGRSGRGLSGAAERSNLATETSDLARSPATPENPAAETARPSARRQHRTTAAPAEVELRISKPTEEQKNTTPIYDGGK